MHQIKRSPQKESIRQLTIFLLISSIISLSGCTTIDSIFGPTDDEIFTAEHHADQLSDNDPEKADAIARVACLKEKKADAESNIIKVSESVNYLYPGAGAIIGIAFGLAQRYRNRKSASALKATVEAIETFKSQGGTDIGNQLIDLLSKNHESSGTKEEIRSIRRQIKKK